MLYEKYHVIKENTSKYKLKYFIIITEPPTFMQSKTIFPENKFALNTSIRNAFPRLIERLNLKFSFSTTHGG